ncbi:unknown protein [Seminavis robusta]|uniref:Uncharacterized protein n=1 Tax=Seminavis robusta TaxID=568900 RepID=A0A9N8EDG8_9STRA|nr:unknown protein [Seminavis robusta]|eukprot:Sro1016_g231600.1 n/a (1478) ;mRNA; f:6434-10867
MASRQGRYQNRERKKRQIVFSPSSKQERDQKGRRIFSPRSLLSPGKKKSGETNDEASQPRNLFGRKTRASARALAAEVPSTPEPAPSPAAFFRRRMTRAGKAAEVPSTPEPIIGRRTTRASAAAPPSTPEPAPAPAPIISRRTTRAAAAAPAPAPKPANKPNLVEKCKANGLKLEHSWALCALKCGPDQKATSHWKKGPCECHDPPIQCKRCCSVCKVTSRKGFMKLEINTSAAPLVSPPSPRMSKTRAQEKIDQTNQELEQDFGFDCVDETTYQPPETLRDVARYLGIPGELNMPSTRHWDSAEQAQEFFVGDPRASLRLVNSMAVTCSKVIDFGLSKSAKSASLNASMQRQVGLALIRRSRQTMASAKAATAASSNALVAAMNGSDSDDDSSDSFAPSSESDDSFGQFGETSLADPLIGFDPDFAIEERDKLVASLLKICNAHSNRKRHAEYRTARAVLVDGTKAKHLNSIRQQNGHKQFGRESRKRATQDFELAGGGKALIPPPITRKRVSDLTLTHALMVMLSTDNVGLWSWGTKTVNVSSRNGQLKDRFELPKVFTRRSKQDIYYHYKATFEGDDVDRPNWKPIGRTLFMEILSLVVSGDSGMLTAVDYVTSMLLHDTCNLLLRIIGDMLASDQGIVEKFTTWLEVTRNFLKVQYIEHARMDEDNECCSHGLQHALGQPDNYATMYYSDIEENSDAGFKLDGVDETTADDETPPSISCNACKFPFFFLHNLEEAVKEHHQSRLDRIDSTRSDHDERLEDVLAAINDAGEKFYLFMAHKNRVAQQQDSQAQIDEEMQQEVRTSKSDGTKVMVVIDWKMKFEPKGRLESTAEHYGKRGISWHGAFAYFYRYQIDQSTGEEYVERVVVKTDQILEGESNQGAEAVLSMFEAFLCGLEDEFPHLKELVVCSDNASCYHKKELILGMALLNLVKGRSIRITRYTHSETQDGKCLIDAHFARGTRQVIKYIKCSRAIENKKVKSSKDLSMALAWNGGIQNSSVQWVGLNHKKLTQLVDALHPSAQKGMEYFARANDIFFEEESFRKPNLCASDPASWQFADFSLRVWAYSNVGEGIVFRCSVGDGTFAPVPEEEQHGKENTGDRNEDNVPVPDDESEDDDDVHPIVQPDEDENNSVISEDSAADLYLDDVDRWKRQSFGSAKELPKPVGDKFDHTKLLTGVNIMGKTSFGILKAGATTTIQSTGMVGNEVDDDVTSDEENEDDGTEPAQASDQLRSKSRAAIPRALAMVESLISSHTVKISAGTDGHVDEYDLAKDFVLDGKKTPFNRGYGRRPLVGDVYGWNRMTPQYHAECVEFCRKGAMNKADKMNAKQMYDLLFERHKSYMIPSEHTIQNKLQPMIEKVNKEEEEKKQDEKKKTKGKTKAAKAKEQQEKEEPPSKEYAAAEKRALDAVKRKIKQRGSSLMKPMYVYQRLYSKGVCSRLTKDEQKKLSDKVRGRWSALKSSRKNRRDKLVKKVLL